jgi:protein-S-isoprenylcysteine O-methyltransferase Ste14
MTTTTEQDSKFTVRTIIGFLGYLLLNPIILFIVAGTVHWGMAWVYFGISILGTILSRVIANKKNPGLLQERARYQEADNIKSWDKVLVPIVSLYGPLAAIIVAGLDKRFDWTDIIPLWVQVLALVFAVLGFGLGAWAMLENRFFSAVVRIQADRGHTVCDTGPYRFVRHPGYAGGILWYLMTPLVLNSTWTFIPMAVSILFTVLRTALEDRTLQQELAGYVDYTRRTHYRLVPGIW